MNRKFYPYRPNLDGEFRDRFYDKAKELGELKNHQSIEVLSQQEYKWATSEIMVNPKQRKIYRAVWMLLRDLLRVGWSSRWFDGNLELSPPEENDKPKQNQQANKMAIRNIMLDPRTQKLLESKEFIERMESTTLNDGIKKKPITVLIANGRELFSKLEHVNILDNEDAKLLSLQKAIKPYLQLVREGEKCSHTGQGLNDIWRYFRYTWATPYESTPGRTMQYLIRDAAQPNHPIMGLASLENVPIIINDRDDHIGWTLATFSKRVFKLDSLQIKNAFNQLIQYIEKTIGDINLEGLCSIEECREPSNLVVQRLITIAARSEEERELLLKEWEEKGDDLEEIVIEKSSLGNISQAAEDALYKRKRAEQLAKLLNAKIGITKLIDDSEFSIKWKDFLESESGQSYIKTALIAQKSRHIGSSMMELNVCGAIPPYNEILGGKLTALVMLSKEIVEDYRSRYGNRPSDIASRLKGEPVIRAADLVYIGTTSLYKVGSSQYNRLKIPKELFGKGSTVTSWDLLGETKGYGTLHISRLTLQCLEETLPLEDRGSINRIFGEGASPKLRTIRAGLEKIFESGQRDFLELVPKHSMARLIYGAWLINNGSSYLSGESNKPHYYFNDDLTAKEVTEDIINYWRKRWLLSRLNHGEALIKLAAFDPQSLLLSHSLNSTKDEYTNIPNFEVSNMPELSYETGTREFLRKLYRGSSAYADRIDVEMLKTIHVETPLDAAIISAIRLGKDVILTGNPGDGKTHLIRVLEPQLHSLDPEPFVEYDASRVTDEQLYNQWTEARQLGRPYCVAVNEAVLINLAKRYPQFTILQEALDQVLNAIHYDDLLQQSDSDVIVFDLSRRNVLSKYVVNTVLNKFTSSSIVEKCAQCPNEGCDFVRNQILLNNQQARERLQIILDRVSRRGYHATLRELQAFVAYLLFAGRRCDQMLQTTGEDEFAVHQLPFCGEGKLFDAIRNTFDPAKISHPIWDDNLVYGEFDSTGWITERTSENGSIDVNNEARFKSRKRAFYFYHNQGGEILQLAGDDETEFANFLKFEERQALRYIIQRINKFFGDDVGSDLLRVWQSHRYNQSPKKVLYSAISRKRQEFEIVIPRLSMAMGNAFELAIDHVILRLKNNHQAKLKIDYAVFELLARADRGVPVMSLEGDATRRIWQFMEHLSEPLDFDNNPEVTIVIFDTVTQQKLTVITDMEYNKYLSIQSNSAD